nr:RNA pyrophosphohydrolase [Klebsiella pneumoniae]
MIDDDGYRPNVGIVICNRQGQVMWARRYGQHSWQFPQGALIGRIRRAGDVSGIV